MSNPEMSDFEEVKIPVVWGHLSGKWWGPKNVQPILATHGWLDNCGTFDTLAPILASNQISILSIDFPGHGHSSHIPEGLYYHFFWDGVLNIRQIVKHYKWKKVRLLGHSLGGAVSFLYAGTYPDEVEFLISLDVASPVTRHLSQVLSHLGKQNDRFLSINYQKEKTLTRGSYEKMARLVQATWDGSITRKSTEILLRRGLKLMNEQSNDDYGFSFDNESDVYCFTFDPRAKTGDAGMPNLECAIDYAKRVKCGYLNIRAKNGMKTEYQNSYETILNEIEKVASKFQFVRVEGTHHVHLNDPMTVAPIILDFVKSYPPVKI